MRIQPWKKSKLTRARTPLFSKLFFSFSSASICSLFTFCLTPVKSRKIKKWPFVLFYETLIKVTVFNISSRKMSVVPCVFDYYRCLHLLEKVAEELLVFDLDPISASPRCCSLAIHELAVLSNTFNISTLNDQNGRIFKQLVSHST